MTAPSYSVGSLVRARGRDWVVDADSTGTQLHLRPLAGADNESCWILPELEFDEDTPQSTNFPEPDIDRRGNSDEINLLQSAMRLRLRYGAGPFRSFGNLSVRPRVYQLVPLLMALRQPVIRLLIADDVGVGKTIEAGLILREMMDSGKVSRFSVLCPPSLAAQWKGDLARFFNIHAEVLSSSTAARLERLTPVNQEVFEHFPFTIISLDYIKSNKHIDAFRSHAPMFIIVDEAHTCTDVSEKKQQRYLLLRALADNPRRHLLLLTATPHSGIESGFYNLLGLLDKAYEEFGNVPLQKRKTLRARLSRQLVQRRRKDISKIDEEEGILPRRETCELSYRLNGAWGNFFEKVRRYCTEEARGHRNRMIWYAMLNLMRCISSSPASAASALRAQLRGVPMPTKEEDFLEAFSDFMEQTEADDRELPPPASTHLQELLREAEALERSGDDPKLALLRTALKPLVRDAFSPIVFCQFISTAEYVAKALEGVFPGYEVCAVTGKLSHDERISSVQRLLLHKKRILVATNCLSEGINLQDGFDAVVHYDLAWNPTRHEQREGRVDRFGQHRRVVRCVMLYGADNPVDGFILNVIRRKAMSIRNELGVSVPVPTDEKGTSEAMVRAVLLGARVTLAPQEQPALPGMEEYAGDFAWRDATEEDKKRATTFAQLALKADDAIKEYDCASRFLGSEKLLRSFLHKACEKLGAPLVPLSDEEDAFCLHLNRLPAPLARRLRDLHVTANDKSDEYRFSLRTAGSAFPCISRAHPLVSSIADFLAEQCLDSSSQTPLPPYMLPRCAVVRTSDVEQVTRVFHLRIRHILKSSLSGVERIQVVEELASLVSSGTAPLRFASPDESDAFAAMSPSSNVSAGSARAALDKALSLWHSTDIKPLLAERSAALQEDHLRVRRDAHIDSGSFSVTPNFPPDLLTILVLQPDIGALRPTAM